MNQLLKGYLPPNLLFIDANQFEPFRLQLDWPGCSINEQLGILHP
jgi:hypothetical protein